MSIKEMKKSACQEIDKRVKNGNISKSQGEAIKEWINSKNINTIQKLNEIFMPFIIRSMNNGMCMMYKYLERYNDDVINYFKFNNQSIIKNNGATKHIIIKGDSYLALQLLLIAYSQKIDIILTDPSYNKESLPSYIPHTRDDYLSLLASVYYISRLLLKNTGVSFSSIDNENLAKSSMLLEEFFGEKNHISILPRLTRTAFPQCSNNFNNQHDFIDIFAKDRSQIYFVGEERYIEKYYSNLDNDPKGPWKSGDPTAPCNGKQPDPKKSFPIKNPYTNQVTLPPSGRQWLFTEEKFNEYIQTGVCIYKTEKVVEPGKCFTYKQYQPKEQNNHFNSIKDMENIYDLSSKDTLLKGDCTNSYATKQLKKEFDFGEYTFQNAKSVPQYKKVLQMCHNKDALILDYFAGSGTVLQAALELNAEDGGHRRCILIDNNEITETTPHGVIDDITIPRCYTMLTGKNIDGSISKSKWLETHKVFEDQLEIVNLETMDINDRRIFDIDYSLDSYGHQNLKKGKETINFVIDNIYQMAKVK